MATLAVISNIDFQLFVLSKRLFAKFCVLAIMALWWFRFVQCDVKTTSISAMVAIFKIDILILLILRASENGILV